MLTRIPFALLAVGFACSLFAAPALAQRDRVFVASYGSDTNPCTFGSPCKTFQQAVNVVAAGGEVTAIDSAGFGPIVITQSVAITSPPGVEAGIVPTSGGDAITINTTAPADITLRGLTLEGTGSGLRGIDVISSLPESQTGGTLTIVACIVKDFTGSGIFIHPAMSGGPVMQVVITDSLFIDNGISGIKISPSMNVSASIYRTVVSLNATGIDLGGATGSISALLVDSNVDNNNNTAISVNATTIIMKHSTATNTNNGNNTDVSVDANSRMAFFEQNYIHNLSNAGFAYSDGTNIIDSITGNALGSQMPQ